MAGGRVVGGDKDASGHVEFEVPMKYPNRGVQQKAAESLALESWSPAYRRAMDNHRGKRDRGTEGRVRNEGAENRAMGCRSASSRGENITWNQR